MSGFLRKNMYKVIDFEVKKGNWRISMGVFAA